MVKIRRMAPFLRNTMRVALLCTIVMMMNIFVGLITWKLFHFFWFAVFLIAFTPTWLACFGLVFATRWRWGEMSAGVFAAVFLALFVYLRDMEGLGFRLMCCTAAGGFGMLTVSLGYAARRLANSLYDDFRQRDLPPRKDTTFKG